jgi:hypothetical protein
MRIRYSFKALLIVVTLAAVALTMFRARLDSSRLQRQAVVDLTAAQVSIRYDYEDDSTIGAVDPFSPAAGANAANGSPTIKINPLRLWIGRMLGRDFVANVKEVHFNRPRSASVIAQLRDLRRIETLKFSVSREFEELQDDAWQELMKCRNVERLELRHDQHHPGRRLVGLSAWQQLRSLTISRGAFNVEDAQEVARLTNLRRLSLGPNYMIDGALGPLSALRRLEEFELGYAHPWGQATNTSVAFLTDLPRLRVVSLSRLPSFDNEVFTILDELSQLDSLSLNLDQSDVTDAKIERLARLKSLTTLSLTRTQVDDAMLEKLRPLTRLKELHLAGTQVTDAGLEHLDAFKNLRVLGLGNVPITDQGIASIVVLSELERLTLSHAEATDAGIMRLGGLSKLRQLWLGDEIPPTTIAELQKLLPACGIVQPSVLFPAMTTNTQTNATPAK